MKKINIILSYLFALVTTFFVACQSETEIKTSMLEVDNSKLEVASEGAKINIEIKSNVHWTISSLYGWTTPNISEGEGNKTIELTIAENLYRNERRDTLTISTVDGTQVKIIEIIQAIEQNPDNNYKYKIPVVFHVIYRDASNEKQYLREGYLQEVMAQVNQIWKEAASNLNIEFVMATEAPNGVKMKEAGVNRVKWNIDKIDYNRFMGFVEAAPKRYRDLLWDQNRYVNICLYNFSDEKVTGVTTLPYTLAPDTLAGLEQLPANISPKELSASYCISVNSLYAYTSPKDQFETTNFISTIAHELGHYFGLLHVFGEDPTRGMDSNKDTDFCNDTPTYNRSKYLRELQEYQWEHPKFTTDDINKWLTRTNSITKENFVSDNIMDYYWTKRNKFTQEQVARIRYVLLHSPFVPGPKIRTQAQRSINKRTFDIHVHSSICRCHLD